MEKNKLESLSTTVLFVGISILLLFVFWPFIPLLALAAVLAILLDTTYEYLTRALNGYKTISAGIMVFLTLVFLIVPFFFLGSLVLQQAQNLYASTGGSGASFVQNVERAVEYPVRHFAPGYIFNVNAFIGTSLLAASNNLGVLAYQTLFVVFQVLLMLLALFFFLRDGRSMLASFIKTSPLGERITSEILSNMSRTVGSVLRGTVVNALIRFGLVWVSFYVAGIPNAVLWSSLGALIGAIPGFGTPFAFVPAVVYLFLQGATLNAVALALFGIAVVIAVDNILTSYFFSRGLAVSPLFVLFSILGGIVFFGPIGFILGPLVLSVFLSVVHVYRAESEA